MFCDLHQMYRNSVKIMSNVMENNKSIVERCKKKKKKDITQKYHLKASYIT